MFRCGIILCGCCVLLGCGFMKVIRLKVPEDVSEVEVRLLVAVELCREGKLTLKQAADLAEMSVWDFYMIGKRKVSFTNIDVEDLKDEASYALILFKINGASSSTFTPVCSTKTFTFHE